MNPENANRVTALLTALVIFDFILTTVAFFFPQLWFDVFHGVAYVDPQGFLRRCGANWAAFLLFQAIALWRWRREPDWLAVVAGVRLSDIFTDMMYANVAQDVTWFARLSLPGMGLVNLAMGVWFLRQYRLLVAEKVK